MARVRRATASGSATPRPARRGLRPRGCGPSVRGPHLRNGRCGLRARLPAPGGAAALGWSRGVGDMCGVAGLVSRCGPAVRRVPAVATTCGAKAQAAPGPRGGSRKSNSKTCWRGRGPPRGVPRAPPPGRRATAKRDENATVPPTRATGNRTRGTRKEVSGYAKRDRRGRRRRARLVRKA